MKPFLPMRKALMDPDLFGSVLAGESWSGWRTLLVAMCGEELTPSERIAFEQFTGRPSEPLEPVEEAYLIIGRRSGKTRAVAILGAYLAALCDWSGVLAPGERASVLILSASLRQATKAFQYIDGIFEHVPALKATVTSRTADGLQLSNGIDVECTPSSWRTLRGGTAVAILVDELAYFRDSEFGSANPDTEILSGARPMLMTTGGPLIAISSPHARHGALWEAYRRDYGPDGDRLILIAKAPSKALNPTIPQKKIDRAYERDPAAAAASFGAEFRTDIELFVSREAVEACVTPGCREIAPLPDVEYRAFGDAAGGHPGGDLMTLSIGHLVEAEIAVQDLLRERRAPFSPDDVVDEFVAVLRRYKITEITLDRWALGFVAEAFEKRGISVVVSERVKSEIYREALALINSRKLELLDDPVQTSQLTGLERRTARGGRDQIDHSPGSRDDVANAGMGVLVSLAVGGGADIVREHIGGWGSEEDLRNYDREQAARRRAA